MPVARWRGKVKRARSAPSLVRVADDQVVALADAREVAVDDGGLEQALGLHPVQPHPQPRPALGLDELLVATGRPRRGAARSPHWPRNVARSSRYAA